MVGHTQIQVYPHIPTYTVIELPVLGSSANKVLVAIRAAQNVRKWGILNAWLYAKNRSVSLGAFKVALWCERNERRKAERLPLFLVRQAD
jgi:hypothetical protein